MLNEGPSKQIPKQIPTQIPKQNPKQIRWQSLHLFRYCGFGTPETARR
jgi:hypothetical protein